MPAVYGGTPTLEGSHKAPSATDQAPFNLKRQPNQYPSCGLSGFPEGLFFARPSADARMVPGDF